MAEKYREMGKAGDGMKTGTEATAEVAPTWELIRREGSEVSFVWCRFDKNTYREVARGAGGLEEMASSAQEDSSFVYFGGVRVKVQGKLRFFHVVYIPGDASALQKGKAQLHKSAVFNAWPGSSAEVSVQDCALIASAIADKMKCTTADLT